jgi:hypothetical protein
MCLELSERSIVECYQASETPWSRSCADAQLTSAERLEGLRRGFDFWTLLKTVAPLTGCNLTVRRLGVNATVHKVFWATLY